MNLQLFVHPVGTAIERPLMRYSLVDHNSGAVVALRYAEGVQLDLDVARRFIDETLQHVGARVGQGDRA